MEYNKKTTLPQSHVVGSEDALGPSDATLAKAADLIKDAFDNVGTQVGDAYARRLAAEIMMIGSSASEVSG